VWGEWQNDDEGQFGMQFLELDTKSAKTIRRLVEPAVVAPEPARDRPRFASMRIDGLEVPVEAEVKRADGGCIVLEQDLTFLRLGRGVDVDVKGRGKVRGRIASIELRHGPLDVPTLVFGVLLDGAPESAAVPAAHTSQPDLAPQRYGELGDPLLGGQLEAAGAEVPPYVDDTFDAETAWDAPSTGASAHDGTSAVAARSVHPTSDADGAAEGAAGVDDDALALPYGAQSKFVMEAMAVFKRAAAGLRSQASQLQSRLKPKPGLADVDAGAATHPVTDDALLHDAADGAHHGGQADASAESAIVRIARASGRISASMQHMLQRHPQPARRRTTSPAPNRPLRAQTPKPQGRASAPKQAPRPRNTRALAMTFAALGLGIGVYALAPRSGAGRIRAGELAAATSAPSTTDTPAGEEANLLSDVPSQVAVSEIPASTSPIAAAPPAPALQAPEPAEEVPAGPAPFGAASLPNGRTFVLRMSGPVRTLEGEAREDGFTVRIPGRLALDRASPIAAAHRAVARAMVLNRGEFAELTVDFLPGMRPKYQVQGKENTLEVTLERF
ncbi:MAG: hypothetical protein RL385_5827, partial [Pseudomonadota bacterium]